LCIKCRVVYPRVREKALAQVSLTNRYSECS
jgi:hypothetical protein